MSLKTQRSDSYIHQEGERLYALEVVELAKSFGGIKAVNRLTFAVRRGGMTSIVGPNGSGKSTLINLLTGIYPFDAGAVIIDGVTCKMIRPFDSRSHGVTRTFQEVRLFGQMTVLENLLLAVTNRTLYGSLFERTPYKYKRECRDVLKRVGLDSKEDALAMNLSFGQRKLLEIGRALVTDVRTFLLDEPFSGLSVQMLSVVQRLLQELKADGRTVIFVSHNMDIVRELSDCVLVINNGSLMAEGAPDDVLSLSEVVEAYLGV